MGNFEDQDADASTTAQDVYIHGYVSGRLFRRGKDAGAEGEGEGEGLPVTVAASYVPPAFIPPSLYPSSTSHQND